MPIYTKTGDKGDTSLFGGKRVAKSDLQVEACGQIDELSSFLGLIIAKLEAAPEKEFLTGIQKDLYHIMASLSGDKEIINLGTKISEFEKRMDDIEKHEPKLNKFILPQGNEIASLFHIARTICRRAERAVIRYFERDKDLEIIMYLNRLSDLLFMFARFYNVTEITV